VTVSRGNQQLQDGPVETVTGTVRLIWEFGVLRSSTKILIYQFSSTKAVLAGGSAMRAYGCSSLGRFRVGRMDGESNRPVRREFDEVVCRVGNAGSKTREEDVEQF
jgi:hypothetical protein